MFQSHTGALAKYLRNMPAEDRVPISDTRALWMLNLAHVNDGDWHWTHNRYLARMGLHRDIARCAENGKVAVIESGMDCDCVQYTGQVHIIDADIASYDKLEQETAEWADGPFSFYVTSPSEAENIHYRSRDRALEAYEDGHPHSIHLGDIDD